MNGMGIKSTNMGTGVSGVEDTMWTRQARVHNELRRISGIS